MNTSVLRYAVNLVQAGMDGAASAREAAGRAPVPLRSVWAPAAVGAVVGATTASWGNRGKSTPRESNYTVAVGGILGAAIGMGCGVAWASRGITGALARGAMRQINIVRDARWLEKNPIDYA